MKIITLYYPHQAGKIRYPQEDAWAINPRDGIFVVADGVHLFRGIEYKKGYPRLSPAGKLAQEFCGNFVKLAAKRGIRESFRRANRSVSHFNKTRDRFSTFSNASAYFAATGAFGKIRNGILEWGHICDASVSVIGRGGKMLLWHTDHHHHNKFDPILAKYAPLDQSYVLRTVFRNALSESGEKLGYGVITGEETAEKYTWLGRRRLHRGEVAVFATDGFEKYLQNASFRKALLTMDKRKIGKAALRLKEIHKNDAEFISERTLIAVRVD